jgi:hypothetical protein
VVAWAGLVASGHRVAAGIPVTVVAARMVGDGRRVELVGCIPLLLWPPGTSPTTSSTHPCAIAMMAALQGDNRVEVASPTKAQHRAEKVRLVVVEAATSWTNAIRVEMDTRC